MERIGLSKKNTIFWLMLAYNLVEVRRFVGTYYVYI
jgi:hypothetical protein